MRNAVNKGFQFDELLYLAALYIMLISQYLTVFGNFKYIGAVFCLIYLMSNRNPIDKKYLQWIYVFAGFAFISIVWALNRRIALSIFIIHLIPCCLFTFATVKYITSYKKLYNIITAIFVCGLILLVYLSINTEEFLLGIRLGSTLNDEDAEGKAWNVNVIGMCLCYSLYAGWLLYNKIGTGIFRRLLFIVSFTLFVVASLLTGSRKVLLMLVIPIGYLSYKRFKKYFLIGAILMVLLAYTGYYLIMDVEFFYSTIGRRAEDMIAIITGNETGYEDNSRFFLIQYGIEWWKDNPIMGVGINCYRVLSNVSDLFRGKNFYAHNNYIELLVDVGVIGTLLYYSGYIYLLRESLKMRSDTMKWVVIFVVLLFIIDTGNVSYYDMRVQLIIAVLYGVLRLERKKIAIKRI